MNGIDVHNTVVIVILLALYTPAWPEPVAARSTDEDFQTWGMVIVTGSVAPSS